jgi:hypothetical protein
MQRAINLAQEGWMGCPHCGRGVNGRYLFMESNLRLLRRLDTALQEAGLATPQVLAVIRDIHDDLAIEADAEHGDTYPEICYDDHNASTQEEAAPRAAPPAEEAP